MSATNLLEAAIINHFFRNTSQTPAAALYAAMLTAVANEETRSVTEAPRGRYARKAITFDAPTLGVTQNSAQIVFDAGAGTITHIGIYDASTSGNLLAVAALSSSRTIASGEQLVFNAGQITLSLD